LKVQYLAIEGAIERNDQFFKGQAVLSESIGLLTTMNSSSTRGTETLTWHIP